jgi:hypothetical protein
VPFGDGRRGRRIGCLDLASACGGIPAVVTATPAWSCVGVLPPLMTEIATPDSDVPVTVSDSAVRRKWRAKLPRLGCETLTVKVTETRAA